MVNEDWYKVLRRGASSHHMCEENRLLLEECKDKHEAISLYKRTIDWALEEGYPDINTLKTFFSDCEDDGVFINRHFNGEVLIDLPVYVFHGCSGSIRTGLNIDKKIIPMLYFANGCDMYIASSDNYGASSRVPLYVFGQNSIKHERSEDIDCVIYKFDVK